MRIELAGIQTVETFGEREGKKGGEGSKRLKLPSYSRLAGLRGQTPRV